MASTFPAAIASEPPPLDASSEDEDSEEFRSHCLKLDVPSGEPTPDSTPFKRPQIKSPGRKRFRDSDTKIYSAENGDDDTVLQVAPNSPTDDRSPPENNSPTTEKDSSKEDSYADFEFANNIDESGSGSEEEVSGGAILSEEVRTEVFAASEKSESPLFQDFESASEQTTPNVNTGSENCDIEINVCSTNVNDTAKLEEAASSSFTVSLLSPNKKANNDASESGEHQSTADQQEARRSESTSPNKNTGEDSNENELSTSDIVKPDVHNYEDLNAIPDPLSDNATAPEALSSNNASILEGNIPASEVTKPLDDDFDGDDFGTFQSVPSSAPKENVEKEPDTTGAQVIEDDDDDDFGDFAQGPAQPIPTQLSQGASNSAPSFSAQTSFDDSGDFADFRDCSFPSFESQPKSHTSAASDISRISTKIETVIKSLFVIDSNSSDDDDKDETLKSIDNEISATNDSLWARVQDFEGSQGLMFKWLNCLTEKHLLKSLNIDNSNIMYHEKWGTIEVPKFAASLVQSPLQPQSFANQVDPQFKIDTHHSLVNNNNNNVTDEAISCQDHDKPPTLSVEAQEILRQLPDLSYMRANTLVFPHSSPSGI